MGIRNWLAGKISTDTSKMSEGVKWGQSADLKDQQVDPLVIYPASIMGGQIVEGDRLRRSNRYLLADQVYWKDERLYSAIELMAIMIQKSIGNCHCSPIRGQEGERSTNQEDRAVDAAEDWAFNMQLPRLFYYYTIDLWKYGDAVDTITFNGTKGITNLTPLPMHAVTAVDKLENLGKHNDVLIDKANWYALDEKAVSTQIADRVIRKDRILHVSFANRRSLVRDNFGRWTFNMWSMPPINSLIGIIEWKQQLIRNDIIWRNRALPREHHKLNLQEYDPSKYTGSHSEKLTKSKNDAQKAIEDYAETNKHREADQGFVTGMGVDIGYIEPKSTTYADPMPIITQINDLLGGPTGTPAALMGGETAGFSALNQSASFLALRAEIYASTIQLKLEELMRRHIRITHPNISEDIVNRIHIKNRLILDRDRSELSKIVAILTGSKVFTPSEIRAIWGLDPMTMKQSQELLEWIKVTDNKPVGSSTEKQTANAASRKSSSPTGDRQTPGQRERNEQTQGDRAGQNRGRV